MKYLLDTDVLINHLRGKEILSAELLEDGAAISIITLAELLYGVYKSDNPDESLSKLEENLNLLGLIVENLNEIVIAEFGKNKAELESLGLRLEDFDLLIAATAIVSKLILVTRNVKHFERIKGLKVYIQNG